MSQFFIKNAQIFEFKYALIMMRVINDYKIFFYDIYNLAFFFSSIAKKKDKSES